MNINKMKFYKHYLFWYIPLTQNFPNQIHFDTERHKDTITGKSQYLVSTFNANKGNKSHTVCHLLY